MVELSLDELVDATQEAIASVLLNETEARITYSVDCYYGAYYAWEREAACLEVWYVAERLAEHAKVAKYDIGDGGEVHYTTGIVKLQLSNFNHDALAACIVELVPAFDPNSDGEARALLYDEAQEWISSRTAFRFTELEQEFREAEAVAKEEGDEE